MKTYKNISNVEQLGLAPNEEGERELNYDEELRMIERGALEVIKDPQKEAAEEAEKAEADAEAATDTPGSSSGDKQSQKGDRGRGKS